MPEQFPRYDSSGLPLEVNPADDRATELAERLNEILFQENAHQIPDNPGPPPTAPEQV